PNSLGRRKAVKPSFLIAAAGLLALGMAAQPADASITVGPTLSTHTTHSATVTMLGHTDGARHMRKFNDDGPDDPPTKKTPSGGAGGSSSGSNGSGGPYWPHHDPKPGSSWVDAYGHWH